MHHHHSGGSFLGKVFFWALLFGAGVWTGFVLCERQYGIAKDETIGQTFGRVMDYGLQSAGRQLNVLKDEAGETVRGQIGKMAEDGEPASQDQEILPPPSAGAVN